MNVFDRKGQCKNVKINVELAFGRVVLVSLRLKVHGPVFQNLVIGFI